MNPRDIPGISFDINEVTGRERNHWGKILQTTELGLLLKASLNNPEAIPDNLVAVDVLHDVLERRLSALILEPPVQFRVIAGDTTLGALVWQDLAYRNDEGMTMLTSDMLKSALNPLP